MSQFLQVLLSGLSTGAIYALAAIGFTLVWQAARTVNFAQGEFVMLPAFFVLIGVHWLHMPALAGFGLRADRGGGRAGAAFQEGGRRADAAERRLPLIISDDGAVDPSEGRREAVLRRRGAALSQPLPADDPEFRWGVVSVQDLMNLIVSLAVVVG